MGKVNVVMNRRTWLKGAASALFGVASRAYVPMVALAFEGSEKPGPVYLIEGWLNPGDLIVTTKPVFDAYARLIVEAIEEDVGLARLIVEATNDASEEDVGLARWATKMLQHTWRSAVNPVSQMGLGSATDRKPKADAGAGAPVST
jgi:hypothetical protein